MFHFPPPPDKGVLGGTAKKKEAEPEEQNIQLIIVAHTDDCNNSHQHSDP